ncbi:MAG: archaeosortase/exosortase family protein, partial [bacterium]
CSGIRSSIGLLITVLIASHLFLKRFFTKALLVTTIIPFVLIKNGIRITTLTLLAVYVDKSYLTDSFLHKSGGVVFFAIALLLMFPILIYLRWLENKREKGIKPGATLFKKRMLT